MFVSCCQCDGLKDELEELQQLYDSSQQERSALEQELQRCKAELRNLLGRKSKVRGQRLKTEVHWRVGESNLLVSCSWSLTFSTPETLLLLRNWSVIETLNRLAAFGAKGCKEELKLYGNGST